MAVKRSEPSKSSGSSEKQLEIAEQMKEAYKEASRSVDKITSSFEQQLKIMMQLRDAMQQMENATKEVSSTQGILSTDGWDKLVKKVKEASDEEKKFLTATQKTEKFLKNDLNKAAMIATGAFKGLGQGVRSTVSIFKSVLGVAGSVAGAVFDLGKALISIPLKIIEDLFEMSKGAGDTSLAQALENVRENFGSLKSESSKTVVDVAKNMGKLDDTGVSAYRVFGNLAERIEAVNKMANAMGAIFQVFQREIYANGEAIMRFNKGLGITDEQMANIGSQALRMEKDLAEVQLDMTKQTLGLSNAFRVNAKVISKDMAKAMADLAHFGHLSTKEMAVAATFANKLGVSVDKLTAIMDATKTFDNTAEQVSRLNEQFGTNINAQELMMEESPAGQIEILRKEFSRAGVDLSKMDRFQREVIKSTGFMGDELLNASLSTKNSGVSFDQMREKGQSLEAQTLTQTQALRDLADSMVRIIKPGETVAGGILQHIIEGFGRGIMQSGPFIKMMINMRDVLQESLMFGRQLGLKFVDMFPGVKDIFTGLSEVFNPARFRDLYKKILKEIDDFSKNGAGKFEDLMGKIEKHFSNFFDDSKPQGMKVLEGFKKFGMALLKIFNSISKYVIEELAGVIVSITEWLKNPQIPSSVSGPGVGFFGSILKSLDGSIKALTGKLLPAIQALGEQLFSMLVQAIKDISPKTKMIIAGVLGTLIFGPAIVGALTGAVAGGLIKSTGDVVSKGLVALIEKSAGSIAKTGAAAAAAGGPGAASTAASTAAAAMPNPEDAKKIGAVSKIQIDLKAVGLFLAGFAGVVAIGLVAFFWAMRKIKESQFGFEDIAKTSLVFAAVGVLMVGAAALAAVAYGLSFLVKNQQRNIVIGMAAMGAIVLSMSIVAATMVSSVKDINNPEAVKAGALMLEVMSTAFLKAGAAILLAIPVGLAIMAYSGAGGLIALSGFAVMTTVVAGISKMAVETMKSLAEIKEPASEVLQKTISFTSIMDSLMKMLDSVTSMLKTLDLGRLDAKGRVAVLNAATSFVEGIVDSTSTLVKTLIKGMKEVPTSSIEPAKAFASVITSIAEMLKSVALAATALSSKDVNNALVVIQGEGNADKVASGLKGLASYFEIVLTNSKTFIEGMITSMSEITDAESFSKIAPAFSGILKSVSDLMGGLFPSIKEYNKKTKQYNAEGKLVIDTEGIDTAAMAQAMTTALSLLDKIKGVLPALLGDTLKQLGPILSGMDKKALDALPAVAEVFKAVAGMFSAITQGGDKGDISINITQAEKSSSTISDVNKMFSRIPDVADVLARAKTILPGLFGDILGLVEKIPSDKSARDAFSEKIKVVSNVFLLTAEAIKSINSAISQFKVDKNVDYGTATNNMLNGMHAVKNLLQGLAVGNWEAKDKGNNLTFKDIVTYLDLAAKMVPEGFDKKIESLTSIFSGIGNIIRTLVGIKLENIQKDKTNTILSNFDIANSTLDALSREPGSALGGIIRSIEALDSLLSVQAQAEILSMGKTLSAVVADINGMFDSLKGVKPFSKDTVDSWATSVKMITEVLGSSLPGEGIGGHLGAVLGRVNMLTAAGIGNEVQAIQQSIGFVKVMTQKLQTLENALERLPTMNVAATLDKIAETTGMGSGGVYTVRSKEVVINLNLEVYMDVAKVEDKLVMRKESVIRDRLNYLLDKSEPGGTKTTGVYTSLSNTSQAPPAMSRANLSNSNNPLLLRTIQNPTSTAGSTVP